MTRTADTLLKCSKCGTREVPGDPSSGPHATGLTNTRTYEGVRYSVAAVECGPHCRHAWWSRTARAHALAQQAKRAARTPGGGTGDVVLGARTEGDA